MTLLVFAILIILLLITAILKLLYMNRKISVELKNNTETKILKTLAFTDALTGIYNRTAYNMRISELNKLNLTQEYKILLLDIDDFKKINDTKGHLAGDEVLKFVANALTVIFTPPKNAVYRIGGDEFAVICKDTTESELIDSMISLRKKLENESDIRLSNGYSSIKENVESAIKYADEMLYADKFSKKAY